MANEDEKVVDDSFDEFRIVVRKCDTPLEEIARQGQPLVTELHLRKGEVEYVVVGANNDNGAFNASLGTFKQLIHHIYSGIYSDRDIYKKEGLRRSFSELERVDEKTIKLHPFAPGAGYLLIIDDSKDKRHLQKYEMLMKEGSD
jgi:hypothetical protein